MHRIKVERKPMKPRPRPEVLPLDPRDPDIVHAKSLLPRPEKHPRPSA
jgi:hypothetical protein